MKRRIFSALAVVILLMLCSIACAGTVTYVYADLQGTLLAEADAGGNITATVDYRPYGMRVIGSKKDGPGYTGHVNDADSELVYMQARYYDPLVGRFISADPIGPYGGGHFKFNRYLYASANPALNVDDDGRNDCGYFCQRMRALSDSFSRMGTQGMANVGGSGSGPGGQMHATMGFINAAANNEIGEGLGQVANVTDQTISLAPGGTAAICVVDGCGGIGWVLAAVGVVPVEGALESKLVSFAGKDLAYLYQKIDAYGGHLKFGITKNPAARYTREELAGGRLKILAVGLRKDMLKLERDLHETLPIGSEEGQKFYIQKQINSGLIPPPYQP